MSSSPITGSGVCFCRRSSLNCLDVSPPIVLAASRLDLTKWCTSPLWVQALSPGSCLAYRANFACAQACGVLLRISRSAENPRSCTIATEHTLLRHFKPRPGAGLAFGNLNLHVHLTEPRLCAMYAAVAMGTSTSLANEFGRSIVAKAIDKAFGQQGEGSIWQ